MSCFLTSSWSSDRGCGLSERSFTPCAFTLHAQLEWNFTSSRRWQTHARTHTDAGVSFARGCRGSLRSPERACIACDSPRGVSMVAKDEPIHLMIRRATSTCSVDEPSARGRGARRELEVQLFNAVNDANYCCKYEFGVISIYNPNNNNANIAFRTL